MTSLGFKTGAILQSYTPEQEDVGLTPASTLEGFGAAAAESFQGSLGPLAARWLQRVNAPDSPTLTADEANQRFSVGDLKFDAPVNEFSARQLYDTKMATMRRDDVVRRSQLGIAGRLTAGLVGAALDPANLAAAVFPEALIARFASIPEAAGGVAGALRAGAAGIQAAREGNIAARAAYGAGEGALGSALITPGTYALSQSEGRDYSVGDAFLDVAFGTALGAGLHAGIGAFAERIKTGKPMPAIEQAMQDAGPQVRMDTLRGAVSDVMEGRPVSIGPMVEQVYKDYAGAEFDKLLWASGKLSDEETATLRRLSSVEAKDDSAALTARIGELDEQARGLREDISSATEKAAPDEVTGQRLEAIRSELAQPAIPAARRVDLENEQRLLTEGRPQDDALEQLRSQAEAEGLQSALGRNEAEAGRVAAKRDRAAATVDRANAEFAQSSGSLAQRRAVVQALAERTIRRAAGRLGVAPDADAVANAARTVLTAPAEGRPQVIQDAIRGLVSDPDVPRLPRQAQMQTAMSDITRAKADPFYDAEDMAASQEASAEIAASPLPKARSPEQGIGAVTRDTQELDAISAELDEQIQGARETGLLTKADEDALTGDTAANDEAQALGKARDLAAMCPAMDAR